MTVPPPRPATPRARTGKRGARGAPYLGLGWRQHTCFSARAARVKARCGGRCACLSAVTISYHPKQYAAASYNSPAQIPLPCSLPCCYTLEWPCEADCVCYLAPEFEEIGAAETRVLTFCSNIFVNELDEGALGAGHVTSQCDVTDGRDFHSHSEILLFAGRQGGEPTADLVLLVGTAWLARAGDAEGEKICV